MLCARFLRSHDPSRRRGFFYRITERGFDATSIDAVAEAAVICNVRIQI